MSDEIRYGGFWRRFFAFIVDNVIWYAFFFCFVLLVFPASFIYFTETGGIVGNFPELEDILLDAVATGTDYTYYAPPLVNFALSLVFALMVIGYFAGMESSSRQATYGKMMFGLKVTDQHVFRIGFWHACGRYLAKVLSVLTLFIGFLMAAFTEKKQALHDIVCKTLVIREGSCFIWPAFKVILLSILFTILVFAGAGVYTYTKYGNILVATAEAQKKVVIDFFGVDLYPPDKLSEGNKQKESTSADSASNFVPTNTPLEQREDGLVYKINGDSPYTGEHHTYFESGQKKEESQVLEGQFHGSFVVYFENGNKKEVGSREAGILHGAYTTWFENGNKKQEVNLVKNIFDGPYRIYFENGQLNETGTYEKGNLHGQIIFWDEEGNFTESRTYENGELDGPYIIYFENGQLSETGTYEKGNLHGQIIFWDEEGNFTESRTYENGELLETSTTPPENLAEVVNSLTADSQDYEAPAPTEETFDLENNNDAASLNAQLKESFHDNGVKKMEAHYVDGKLNGSSTLWDEYGQKIIIVNYKEDNRHGLLTRWHSNGQKKIEINYTDNKRDGEMTFWKENGEIKKILTYSNGELIEKEREYD